MKKFASVLCAVAVANVLSGAVFYVSNSGTAGASADSWGASTSDLQRAVDLCAASGGGEVWVAGGTYVPQSIPNARESSNSCARHFSLRNGVKIMGGFPLGATSPQVRNTLKYKTVLSGDLKRDDSYDSQTGAVSNISDNVYNVLYIPKSAKVDSTAVVDGVVISGGSATGLFLSELRGSGAYLEGASPTFVSCIFSKNRCGDEGGAVFVISASPKFSMCRFEENKAGNLGGAVAAEDSQMSYSNCVFRSNTACCGGGIYAENFDTATFVNTTMCGNSAYLDGAAAAFFGNGKSKVSFANSTIADNTAESASGSSIFARDALVSADSSILWNGGASKEIETFGAAQVPLSNSVVRGGAVGANISDKNPELMPLADNGGAVPTMAVSADSSARGLGGKSESDSDARGIYRGESCTAGAYEYLCGTGYEKWVIAAGLQGSQMLPTAVLGSDGVPNAQKFAFGVSPAENLPFSPDELKYYVELSDGFAAFGFAEASAASGVSAVPQYSYNLTDWFDCDAPSVISDDGKIARKTVVQRLEKGEKIFFRLKFE